MPDRLTPDELRDLLLMARRSQGWLADQLGVRTNTVWKWANGREKIPPSRDRAIRELLMHDLPGTRA